MKIIWGSQKVQNNRQEVPNQHDIKDIYLEVHYVEYNAYEKHVYTVPVQVDMQYQVLYNSNNLDSMHKNTQHKYLL